MRELGGVARMRVASTFNHSPFALRLLHAATVPPSLGANNDQSLRRRSSARRSGRIGPSRSGRGRRRGRPDRVRLRRRRPARLPALGGQGAAGAAADRERRRRPARPQRAGDRARLRLAFGRRRARRAGPLDARQGGLRRKRPRMRRALAARRSGRPGARPFGRKPRRRFTTIARASTPDSSASPASPRSRRRAMSRGITRCSARSRRRWRT